MGLVLRLPLLGLVATVSVASADVRTEGARPPAAHQQVAGSRGGLAPAPGAPRFAQAARSVEIGQVPRVVEPGVVRRVLQAAWAVDDQLVEPSLAERDPSWVELPATATRLVRPRVMLDVMSFPTGGSGIKVLIRY